REKLYAEFITEAAQLQLDAFGHQLGNATGIVKIYSLLNRVRLSGGEEVVRAAERCVDEIIDSYFAPNITLAELHERQPWHKHDPLREFSEACRREMNVSVGKNGRTYDENARFGYRTVPATTRQELT